MGKNEWRLAAKPLRIYRIEWFWYLLIFLIPMNLSHLSSYLSFIFTLYLLLFYLNYKKKSVSYFYGKIWGLLRGNHLTGRPFWMKKQND